MSTVTVVQPEMPSSAQARNGRRYGRGISHPMALVRLGIKPHGHGLRALPRGRPLRPLASAAQDCAGLPLRRDRAATKLAQRWRRFRREYSARGHSTQLTP